MLVHIVSHEGNEPKGAGSGGFNWFTKPEDAETEYKELCEALQHSSTIFRFDITLDLPLDTPEADVTEAVEAWMMEHDFTPPANIVLKKSGG